MGFGKDGKGAILRESLTQALGALGSKSAIRILTDKMTLGEDFRMLKLIASCFGEGFTDGQPDDLFVGICNGELSDAEIAAALVTNGPSDRNTRTEVESAERMVQIIGALNVMNDDEKAWCLNEQGGPMLVHKPRWTFSNPEGWNYFIYNNGSALTTGASVRLLATEYGVWVT